MAKEKTEKYVPTEGLERKVYNFVFDYYISAFPFIAVDLSDFPQKQTLKRIWDLTSKIKQS